MESFLDFIFGNLFFVILILVSLFSFINNLGQNQKKKAERASSEQQREKRTLDDPFKRLQDMLENIEQKVETAIEPEQANKQETKQSNKREEMVKAASIEEQKEAQIERIKEQLVSPSFADERAATLHNIVKNTEQDRSIKKPSFNLEQRLNHQGLVDSIIMAEVLGPPRARKPHRRMVSDRR